MKIKNFSQFLTIILLVLSITGMFCVGMLLMPHSVLAATMACDNDCCNDSVLDANAMTAGPAACCLRQINDTQVALTAGQTVDNWTALAIAGVLNDIYPSADLAAQSIIANNIFPPPERQALRFIIKRE